MSSEARPPQKQKTEAIKAERQRSLLEREPAVVSALEDIRSALDRNAIVVTDTTGLSFWAYRSFEVYEPRSYLSYTYFGPMGFGLATAIGAKIAQPDRQVVAICGDGGFQVTSQELATAVQYGANIVVILTNNDCYGSVRNAQRHHYSGRCIAVDLVNPDFVRLAEAYGANGIRISQLSELRQALQEALSANKATVIEVPVHGILTPR